jgi:hypothetical protein
VFAFVTAAVAPTTLAVLDGRVAERAARELVASRPRATPNELVVALRDFIRVTESRSVPDDLDIPSRAGRVRAKAGSRGESVDRCEKAQAAETRVGVRQVTYLRVSRTRTLLRSE